MGDTVVVAEQILEELSLKLYLVDEKSGANHGKNQAKTR